MIRRNTSVYSSNELLGAESDTESEDSRAGMTDARREYSAVKNAILAKIENTYIEDPDWENGLNSKIWGKLEPRSFLDKFSDNFYHADLLTQAQMSQDPYQRFKGVLKWFFSGLYRNLCTTRPYYPVLGETFRCCWMHQNEETYTYYVAEQVSKGITAFYVSNRKDGFVIEGSLLTNLSYYGTETSPIIKIYMRVHLLNWGETYVTTTPPTTTNISTVHIICSESGYQADVDLNFRINGSLSGRIFGGEETVATIYGHWERKIDINDRKAGEKSSLLDVYKLNNQRLPRYLVKLNKQNPFESQNFWFKMSQAINNQNQGIVDRQRNIQEKRYSSRELVLASAWIPRFFRRKSTAPPLNNIIDLFWQYNHINTSPWQADEVIEFEDEFKITSARVGAAPPPLEAPVLVAAHVPVMALVPLAASTPRVASCMSDLSAQPQRSDFNSHDDISKTSLTAMTATRTRTLNAMEATLREQTVAMENISEDLRKQNLDCVSQTTQLWVICATLAIVLQEMSMDCRHCPKSEGGFFALTKSRRP